MKQANKYITSLIKNCKGFFMRYLLLFLVSLIFYTSHATGKSNSRVRNGILELSMDDFTPGKVISLEGKWAFYWKKLYVPGDFTTQELKPDTFLTVPGTWNNIMLQGKPTSHTGFATYRLIIHSPQNTQAIFYVKEIISASKIWFNGQLIAATGKVSSDASKAVPEFKIEKKQVWLKSGANEIVVQVSNFNHRLNSFEVAPVIGDLASVDAFSFKNDVVDFSIMGVLAIMAFYHFGLFLFLRKNLSTLIFSIFCLAAITRILVSASSPLQHMIPHLNWNVLYFFKYLTLYSFCPLVGLLVQLTFQEKEKKWLFYSFYIFSGIFILTLFLPVLIYSSFLIIYEAIALVYFTLGLGGMLVKYVIMKKEGAGILLISVILLAITGINDMLYFQDIINSTELLPLGIFILVLGQALTLSKQFSAVYVRNEELSKTLDYKNKNLVQLVKEGTIQLEEEKVKLASSNKELRKYYTAIEQAHTTVVITDADGNIEYANPQFEFITGYSTGEVLGKNPRILSSGKTPKETFAILWETIKGGRVWKGEFINRKKNGDEFIESVTISPVFDLSGRIANFIAIKEDISEKKAAEKALKESEEKYRFITERTEDIIWKLDVVTMKFSYMSPSCFNLAGYTPEEMMEDTFDAKMPPTSRDKLSELLRQYLSASAEETSTGLRTRHQIIGKDGRLIEIEAAFSLIRDENRAVHEIVGVSRDISTQVKIENDLIESEIKLAKLLENQTLKNNTLLNQLNYIYNNTSNGIAFFKVEGDDIFFISCNSRWAIQLGFSIDEIEDKNINYCCDPDTEALYRKFIFQAMHEERIVQEYCKWHGMDLYVNIIPLKDENYRQSFACFVYDVTKQLNDEIKIRESEAKFFNIFNNSKDAIVLLTTDLKIAEFNHSFSMLFGPTEHTADTGIEFLEFVPENLKIKINRQIEQLKHEGSIATFECELFSYDGTLISVEFSSSLINQNNESLLLCIIRDISSRKQMERMLTQVGIQIENRERRRLATDLHDNVGPLLSSMNMYLSTLSRKRELIPHIDTLTDVRRILKDTIASVREISNNISPQILNSYGLTSALEMFFETKKKLVNLEIKNSIADLRFEESKEIMIYNIIKEAFNNSLKYSRATEIYLEIFEKNTFINVLYKDNGIGFNLEEKLSRVTTSLGLFSIINRVKNLDGEYVIKTNPGGGFELNVVFPIEIVNEDAEN